MKCYVAGAGGMIGGYLTKSLLDEGHEVYAADIKPRGEWLQWHDAAVNYHTTDLSDYTLGRSTIPIDTDEVYLLAANMGGIGFIEEQPLECILSVDITSATLKAARDNSAKRVFYSSSACAYPIDQQQTAQGFTPLTEDLAWQGRAEYGYGEEKLFSESLCEFFDKCTDTKTRVARYHNIYAPAYTTFKGGREKAPAAICRKIAEGVINKSYEIEIWGDGTQTRSFCYIDDCVEGTKLIMRSDYNKPLNLGSEEMVTINELVDMVEEIATGHIGLFDRRYNLDAPQGVKGRNSNNELIRRKLGWEPTTKLKDGLAKTYEWIYNEVKNAN